jgi:hypothetical protein
MTRAAPHRSAQGAAFKKHLPRVQDYLWVAEDGMKMQGAAAKGGPPCRAAW